MAASHRLKPVAAISADRLTDEAVVHVRACLADRPLVKVRIHAETAAECDAAAADVARRVPCEVVKRIGRVVLLYGEHLGLAAGVGRPQPDAT